MSPPGETSMALQQQRFRCSTETGTSYLQVSSHTVTVMWWTLNTLPDSQTASC